MTRAHATEVNCCVRVKAIFQSILYRSWQAHRHVEKFDVYRYNGTFYYNVLEK